jgi:hypothetical protein
VDAHHRLYRGMVRLYPRTFRHDYGEALEQHFTDLVADRGLRAAWARTTVDLVVTLPRYRMESLMSERTSTTTLTVVTALLVAAGAISFLTGFGPGLLLLGLAVVLVVSQRSQLARSIRTPDTDLRRRRLRTGAVLVAVFVASYTIYILTIGDSWTVRESILALIGTVAMVAGPVYLIAGLLTPKSSSGDPLPAGR